MSPVAPCWPFCGRPRRTRCRAVKPRRQHHQLRQRDLVGGHHPDHNLLRRPLPDHCHRTPGGFRADDWRDRPAGDRHRHLGVLAGRNRRSREKASRGPASHGPPTRGQDRRHSLKFSTPSDRSACISSEQDDQGRRRATAAAWQDRQNVLVLTSGSSEEAGPCPIPALGPRRSRS